MFINRSSAALPFSAALTTIDRNSCGEKQSFLSERPDITQEGRSWGHIHEDLTAGRNDQILFTAAGSWLVGRFNSLTDGENSPPSLRGKAALSSPKSSHAHGSCFCWRGPEARKTSEDLEKFFCSLKRSTWQSCFCELWRFSNFCSKTIQFLKIANVFLFYRSTTYLAVGAVTWDSGKRSGIIMIGSMKSAKLHEILENIMKQKNVHLTSAGIRNLEYARYSWKASASKWAPCHWNPFCCSLGLTKTPWKKKKHAVMHAESPAVAWWVANTKARRR